jgi:hypothetical protein
MTTCERFSETDEGLRLWKKYGHGFASEKFLINECFEKGKASMKEGRFAEVREAVDKVVEMHKSEWIEQGKAEAENEANEKARAKFLAERMREYEAYVNLGKLEERTRILGEAYSVWKTGSLLDFQNWLNDKLSALKSKEAKE